MKMRLLVLAILAAVLLVAVACAPGAPQAPVSTSAPAATSALQATSAAPAAAQPTTAARSGGVLRIGQDAADLGNLDPDYATTTQDRSTVDMVFNALIRYKPGDGSVFEPDLATALPDPQTVDGKRVWTFQLRKGVMCQPMDGVPAYELTSDDVVYSLKKAANKDTSAYAASYTGISADAPDAYTVKVTLSTPVSKNLFYPLVANYSGGFVLCKKAAEKLGAAGLKTHPVGTGPFMFKSYTPQEKVVLVANDAYFRGKPQLDSVEVRYMADLTSRELGLRGGQLDVIKGTSDKAWVDKLASAPNVKVDVFGVGEVATLLFNQNIPPLDKLPVRQAIAYALSRDQFLALVGPQVGASVYSPVPAQFLAGGLTLDEVKAKGVDYSTDIAKSKQLLTQAGFPNGFSLDLVTSEMSSYKTLYESLQAQLAKVGIKINLKVVDHSSFHAMIRKDVDPLVIYIAWRPNADVYLTQFFHSDSIVVTGKKPDTNFSHYDKIDNLIQQARAELDPAKQVDLWKQAQIQILQDMVAYPIQYQNQVYARSTVVDYGHPLKSVLALYPGVDETTHFVK